MSISCNLDLFERNNIARCAVLRAKENVTNSQRFADEFTTVKMWTRYKCYISTKVSFVEPD